MNDVTPATIGGFLQNGRAYIKNPLGIIGLFVALIYGTAVVVAGFSQLLTEWQRWALVLFAVLFPFPILGTFFRLVTAHHAKLYAPADWKDERLFFGPQSTQVREEREEREASLLEAPVDNRGVLAPEVQSQSAATSAVAAETGSPAGLQASARRQAREGEDLAFKWLATQFANETIYRDVTITGPNRGVAFDGIVSRTSGRHVVAIEVKVVRGLQVLPRMIRQFAEGVHTAIQNVRAVENPGTIAFMLIVVTIGLNDDERSAVENLSTDLLRQQGLTVDLRVIDIESLREG